MKFSPVVAGVWRAENWGLDAAGLLRWMQQAVELGITTFPTFDDGKKVLDLDGAISEYRSQIPNISIPALLQMQAALSLLDREQKRVPARDPRSVRNAAELDNATLDSFRRKFVKLESVNGLLDVAGRGGGGRAC